MQPMLSYRLLGASRRFQTLRSFAVVRALGCRTLVSSTQSSPSDASASPFASPPSRGTREKTGADTLAMRTQILDAALRHVAVHGWTTDALAAGADELGLPAASSGLFPSGAVELVWHLMRHASDDMSVTLSNTDLASLSVDERIALGVSTRLASFAPYRRTWASAMALGASPLALPETLRLLAVASDEIWWAAGDRSTDASWYSRRVLLMGLSAASETFMLTDETPNLADTKAFISRRLEELCTASAATRDGMSIAFAAATGASAAAAAIFDVLLRSTIIARDGEGLAPTLTRFTQPLGDLIAAAKRAMVANETIKHNDDRWGGGRS